MHVCVQFYARARDLVGLPQVDLEIAEASTVADLRRRLAEQYAPLKKLLEKSAVAVDEEFADDRLSLRHGAVVAILPPVSGG